MKAVASKSRISLRVVTVGVSSVSTPEEVCEDCLTTSSPEMASSALVICLSCSLTRSRLIERLR